MNKYGIVGCDETISEDRHKLSELSINLFQVSGDLYGINKYSSFPDEFFDAIWIDNSTVKFLEDQEFVKYFKWLKSGGNLYIPYESENQASIWCPKGARSPHCGESSESPLSLDKLIDIHKKGFIQSQIKKVENGTGVPIFSKQDIVDHNIRFLSGIFNEKNLFVVEFNYGLYPIKGYQGNSNYQAIGYYMCSKIKHA